MLYPFILEEMLSLNEIIKDVCGLNLIPVLAVNDFLMSSLPVFRPTSDTDAIPKFSLKPRRYANGISPSIPFDTLLVRLVIENVKGSIFLDSL